MYDTVNSYKYASLSNENFIDALSPYINITGESIDKDKKLWIKGNLRNYKLTISKTKIYMTGSIAKFALKDNFQVLGRSDTEAAFQESSDLLHTDVSKFFVSRVDLGANFILSQPVCNYLNYLGDCNGYTRLEMGKKGIEYRNKLRSLAFYDKADEIGAKNLPPDFCDNNILRYEWRIKKRTRKELKQSELITVAQLYDQLFYIDIIDRWYAEYQKIKKINIMNTDVSSLKNLKPNDFINLLTAERINEIGYNKVLKLIQQMGANNQFARPEYISRVKNSVKQMANNTSYSEYPELIRELDADVKRVLTHYR